MASLIEDYARIGNCETCALVDRDASINWLCVQRRRRGLLRRSIEETGEWPLADNYGLFWRVDDARKLFEKLVGRCDDIGILTEEYDPHTKPQVGNFPQALSHFRLISTAFNLSRVSGPAGSNGDTKAPAPRAANERGTRDNSGAHPFAVERVPVGSFRGCRWQIKSRNSTVKSSPTPHRGLRNLGAWQVSNGNAALARNARQSFSPRLDDRPPTHNIGLAEPNTDPS